MWSSNGRRPRRSGLSRSWRHPASSRLHPCRPSHRPSVGPAGDRTKPCSHPREAARDQCQSKIRGAVAEKETMVGSSQPRRKGRWPTGLRLRMVLRCLLGYIGLQTMACAHGTQGTDAPAVPTAEPPRVERPREPPQLSDRLDQQKKRPAEQTPSLKREPQRTDKKPAAGKQPTKKPQPSGVLSPLPPPAKPPAIGGSGG